MAGAILPPLIFPHLIGLYCSREQEEEENEKEEVQDDDCILVEDELGLEGSFYDSDYDEDDLEDEEEYGNGSTWDESKTMEFVRLFLKQTLPSSVDSFQEANAWQKSRVTFPQVSLDQVRIDLRVKDEALEEDSLTSMSQEETSTEIKEPPPTICPLPFVFTLECRIDGDKSLSIPITSEFSLDNDDSSKTSSIFLEEILQMPPSEMEEWSRSMLETVLYEYTPQCSASFLAMSLALRYKCPIVITDRTLLALGSIQAKLKSHLNADIQLEDGSASTTNASSSSSGMMNSFVYISTKMDEKETNEIDSKKGKTSTEDDQNEISSDSTKSSFQDYNKFRDAKIQAMLPQWRSVHSLETQSQRVVTNIEQGFKLTRLQSALNIARDKGDDLAIEKIQAEIEKLMAAATQNMEDEKNKEETGTADEDEMEGGRLH